MISRRLEEWGRFPGCGKVRAALEIVREGAESPKETETRMLLLDFRLPEPVMQHSVFADGRFIARVDLAYPQWWSPSSTTATTTVPTGISGAPTSADIAHSRIRDGS